MKLSQVTSTLLQLCHSHNTNTHIWWQLLLYLVPDVANKKTVCLIMTIWWLVSQNSIVLYLLVLLKSELLACGLLHFWQSAMFSLASLEYELKVVQHPRLLTLHRLWFIGAK